MFDPQAMTGFLTGTANDYSSPVNQRARGDYTRQRQMGIGDLLLENRIIFLDGVINDGAPT